MSLAYLSASYGKLTSTFRMQATPSRDLPAVAGVSLTLILRKVYGVMASLLAENTAHLVFNVRNSLFCEFQLQHHYNAHFCECQSFNSPFCETFCLQTVILAVKYIYQEESGE